MGTALRGRTIVMSGGSRGIGLAILVAAAREGANAVILAKTDKPDPRLPGTVHTAVEAIEQAGGSAVAVVGDVRDEADVERAVSTAAERFGGVDVCVNNASAITLQGTEELPVKRFDLMQSVNSRGTFLLTRACLPYLRESDHAHILTLSPPLNLAPRWLGAHPAYTLSKYGMTLLTLGWAAEYAEEEVAANCLWPQTVIATAAVANVLGGEELTARSRGPEIIGDAAVAILSRPSAEQTGRTLIDADVLAEAGITNLSHYGGGDEPELDLFVDPASAPAPAS
ncbi:NAD(P)-dependent oxidoreductase [Streptomyces sp. Je 1-4]|uniref:SDR family oxidoreductase n=1 Tax=Streptomyces TaxID=1883 RepID=UPI00140EF069|nr:MULTISPECIES: NAD(P)-dependent oxidoreductase [unclassified Streptomyces]QIK05793.1 NAD(P)-dependent oxidoreductase [Streptomyces sp. ID38640]UYB39052.1 NAD(P)-dependent oxidoreductase [Streptomyces sp. Je 1-4]UZQ35052.1 NAD(P)-dependent oxidoreductase [Streptomyces sp. Je 1-4] [Streptomyces sp. Je 1-4 4N24]UZQ42470.1 NAD(P)-dependent oxidoreductase [Streptomyces sp. Je 1-4] [Streptomyces sp. Je 1-4 4N24_ara]